MLPSLGYSASRDDVVVRRAIQHHDDPINGSQQGWHGVAAVAVIVEVVIVTLAVMRMLMIFR